MNFCYTNLNVDCVNLMYLFHGPCWVLDDSLYGSYRLALHLLRSPCWVLCASLHGPYYVTLKSNKIRRKYGLVITKIRILVYKKPWANGIFLHFNDGDDLLIEHMHLRYWLANYLLFLSSNQIDRLVERSPTCPIYWNYCRTK